VVILHRAAGTQQVKDEGRLLHLGITTDLLHCPCKYL
jgi:hypothetical protein